MCVHPIQIPNPNLGIRKNPYAFCKDTESQYIYVPCKHCSQCIALEQMYLVQRIQMECLVSHPFFCTLTYNNEHLPSITTSSGYDLTYAAYKDLQDMFKRIRNYDSFGRPFRYIAVTERGKKGHRPHMHLIWLLPKYERDTKIDILNLEQTLYREILKNWVTNIGSDKKPIYVENCTYVRKIVAGKLRYNYDLHYCDQGLTNNGISEVGFYVLKYMLKKNSYEEKLQQALKMNLEEDEYKDIYNLVKSRAKWSKGFGCGNWKKGEKVHPKILEYLHGCIDKTPSNNRYPCFFSPTTGAQFPLAPYFKRNTEIYPLKKQIEFAKRAKPYEPTELLTPAEVQQAVHEFEKIREQVEKHDSSRELNLLYE